MEQQLTNDQILGRLRAELKGYRIEKLRRGDGVEITAPDGRTVRKRFDEVRTPVALQSAIQAVRRRGGKP